MPVMALSGGGRMRAGRLRHKIIIEYQVSGYDEYNSPITTWEKFAEVWAAVEPLRGQEYFAAQQAQAETEYRVITRYVSGIDTNMRIAYNDKYLEIESIIDREEKHRELEIMCREVHDSED